MSLPRLDRIDRFGHCCICASNLITKKVIDGKEQEVFVPEYGDAKFLLNDGSKMQVTICKVCQNTYELTDPSVQSDIMDAVKKGWELETKLLTTNGSTTPDGNFIKWSKENGDKYLEFMQKKNIDIHIGSIDNNVLLERSKRLSKEFIDNINKEKNTRSLEVNQ